MVSTKTEKLFAKMKCDIFRTFLYMDFAICYTENTQHRLAATAYDTPTYTACTGKMSGRRRRRFRRKRTDERPEKEICKFYKKGLDKMKLKCTPCQGQLFKTGQ